MSSQTSDECPEFGVLFVPGFAEQRPGSAIASFATALYRWLFRWNASPNPRSASLPALSHAVLSGLSETGDEPAHVTLTVPLSLSTGERDARWLLAESSWADLFTPPGFLGIALWIWKVSTCLLVLQFVIPMRRHWHRARRSDKPWHRRAADLIVAVSYLVPMAVAAMASVLLSLVLLALAVAEKLPIPRIDQGVRWVAVKVSAVLGDSYMLAHCPVQFAAMHTQVARDLRWLQDRCGKVAVVAHSQGAAIAHQVLKDGAYRPGSLRAFVTLGQGISKFHLLQRMDWNPRAHRAAWWSRLLVTGGLAFAGLPILGLLARHWTSALLVTKLSTLPVSMSLILSGFALIAIGVVVATHALCGDLEQDLALPAAGFSWTDYYASADPVSNGPLAPSSGRVPAHAGAGRASTWLLPRACNQVYNSASILFDHNRYLRNEDQLLSRMLNDLAVAAYADGPVRPEIVRDGDLSEVGRRRHRLVLWLIGARILVTALAAGLWSVNLGIPLKGPMNRMVQLLTPSAGMDDGLARLVSAVLIAGVVYIAAVIVWRIREGHVMRSFFHTAEPFISPPGQLPPQAAPQPLAKQESNTSG